MKLRNRILTVISVVAALAIATFAYALSHDSSCAAPDALPEGAQRMKAVTRRCYGPVDVLKLEELEKPIPEAGQVLVKVRAASVNPLDWHMTIGMPYVMRMSTGFGAPANFRIGTDFAGVVERVGENVTRFKVGDEVFGARTGAMAEYIVVREAGAIVPKPPNLSFEQAAAIPVAAITALQALRDKGKIQRGQKVLINGASGGVGTFAVQIAKAYGAEVTGVCSTRNVAMVRSLGADKVIDYTQENFTQATERYDLILDNVGNHSMFDLKRVLKPGATVVMAGGPKSNHWIGPLSRPVKALFISPFVDENFISFLADITPEDLVTLSQLAQQGALTSVIDRRYPLTQSVEAMRYVGTQRARGKVVMTID